MADGSRRKQHRPVFVVANPDSSDEDSHLPHPLNTTNLPDRNARHQAYSNPTLSSPSGTSSPPPSTPGQPLPPVDIPVERPDAAHVNNSTEAIPQQHSFFPNTRMHFFNKPPKQTRRPNGRPATSPSTSTTSDSFTPRFTPDNRSSPIDKVCIFVTGDSDQYYTVDITGFTNAAFIKELMFSKLRISDEEQSQYSVYRTQVNSYAIGEALSDEALYNLCRDEGDAECSLKFLVANSAASVHEDSRSSPSPTTSTIPPPVLLPVAPYPPQRRRSPSRHESASSTSERNRPELTNGYDPSVSDDLDNGEVESQRSTLRPPPKLKAAASTQSFATSTSRRPNGPQRPTSPTKASTRIMSPSSGSRQPRSNFGQAAPPPPLPPPPPPPPALYPHSPNHSRTMYDDEQTLQPSPHWTSHVRSGSDAAADRERYQTSESNRPPQRKEDRSRLGRTPREKPSRQRTDGDPYNLSQESSWGLADRDRPSPSPTGRREQDKKRYQQAQSSYPRPQPPSNPPRQPSSASQHREQRGTPVPTDLVMKWKSSSPASTSTYGNSLKTAKSENSLRDRFVQHPTTLQPGGARPPVPRGPPLSTNPSMLRDGTNYGTNISSGYFGDENTASPRRDTPQATSPDQRQYAGYTSPTSYRTGGFRPFPPPPAPPPPPPPPPPPVMTFTSATPSQPRSPVNQGLSSNPMIGKLPFEQESHSRPGSSLGTLPVPSTTYRPQHTAESAFDEPFQESDVSRSSPSQIPHYRPLPSTYNTRGGKLDVDTYNVHGDNGPPRSPVNPRSPPFLRNDTSGEAPHSPSRGTNSDDAATVRQDDMPRMQKYLDQQVNTGTYNLPPPPRPPPPPFVPRFTGFVPPPPPPPPPSQPLRSLPRPTTPPPKEILSTPSTPETNSTDTGDGSDSESGGTLWQTPMVEDESGGTLWQKHPSPERPRSSGRGPPLTVKIDDTDASPTQVGSSNSYNTAIPNNFPPPPNEPPPVRPYQGRAPASRQRTQDRLQHLENEHSDAFQEDQSWASRPDPDEMYRRLDTFFPDHDLDKPVIDTTSGGTSPTTAEPTVVPQPAPADKRSRHKKSIRVVAEEHKQKMIDRSSRILSTTAAANNMLRKRSTKLWGSRLEEVTPGQIKAGLASTTPESPSSAGSVAPKPIFKWVRGELIGKGNFGRVYMALNATTGEVIAVKQVEIPRTASDKNDSRQVGVVDALKLESETLKDLDHPHIVQYLGFEETPTFLSIFLEYVPGGSVGSCLRKYGKFDEEITKSFTEQILDGLEYLHSVGILHRDLKADNILVEQDGKCKISDFGISKRTNDINEQAMLTAMQGTVFWMAPEVVNAGKRGYNAKVDIWSVGCVVLEMWAGERPWRREEAMAVIVKLYSSKQAPPVPQSITLSALADDFRKKCFAINPDERPSAAELRKHPYLVLPPGWTFTGFSAREPPLDDVF